MKNANHLLAAAVVAASFAMPAVASELAPGSKSVEPSVTKPSFHQWNEMAKSEASTLAPKLKAYPGPWLVAASPQNKSIFSASFTKMLISELSAHGVKLTNNPNTAAVIELQVESIKLKADYPVVQGLHDFVDAGSDVIQLKTAETVRKPHAELAINLVATSHGAIVASTTNIYVLAKQSLNAYTDPAHQTLKFSK